MMLTEYQCTQEGHFFYVQEHEEPLVCPCCGCLEFDYTNDVITY